MLGQSQVRQSLPKPKRRRCPLLALRYVPLRVTALVAIGGIADMNGCGASAKSVEIDAIRNRRPIRWPPWPDWS
jgi:hypothetical protein